MAFQSRWVYARSWKRPTVRDSSNRILTTAGIWIQLNTAVDEWFPSSASLLVTNSFSCSTFIATSVFRLINASDCGWWIVESSAWPNHRKCVHRRFSFSISTRTYCCIDTRFPRSSTLSSRSTLIQWARKIRFDWLKNIHSLTLLDNRLLFFRFLTWEIHRREIAHTPKFISLTSPDFLCLFMIRRQIAHGGFKTVRMIDALVDLRGGFMSFLDIGFVVLLLELRHKERDEKESYDKRALLHITVWWSTWALWDDNVKKLLSL